MLERERVSKPHNKKAPRIAGRRMHIAHIKRQKTFRHKKRQSSRLTNRTSGLSRRRRGKSVRRTRRHTVLAQSRAVFARRRF